MSLTPKNSGTMVFMVKYMSSFSFVLSRLNLHPRRKETSVWSSGCATMCGCFLSQSLIACTSATLRLGSSPRSLAATCCSGQLSSRIFSAIAESWKGSGTGGKNKQICRRSHFISKIDLLCRVLRNGYLAPRLIAYYIHSRELRLEYISIIVVVCNRHENNFSNPALKS
jgi:hypothetical protein